MLSIGIRQENNVWCAALVRRDGRHIMALLGSCAETLEECKRLALTLAPGLPVVCA